MTVELEQIGAKVAAGERLDAADADVVAAVDDLLALGALADERRRQRHGDRVTFVRVLQVALPERADRPVPEIPAGAGEVRIVGQPAEPEHAIAAVSWIASPGVAVPITGFALDDLAATCGGTVAALGALLRELHTAGLAGIAEARVERLSSPEWLQVAEDAAVPVGQLTIHEPGDGDETALVRRVAGWGGDAAAHAFAPLRRAVASQSTTGYRDVRQVALARLLVDNIESVQVDWSLYGPKLAQVALTFGANDVDAVSPLDSAEHGWRRAPREEVTRNIRAAALVPVERNGRFETR